MDSDLDSSLMLLRVFPAASLVAAFLPFMLFGPVALYLIARWRSHRAPVADPHLGLKFAMHTFASTSLYFVLAGAAFLIFTIIGPGPSSAKGDWYRIAFALLVPAGMVLGLHLMMIRRTNDQEMPGVRRLFLGYNLIVVGTIGFLALLFAFQMLFAKGNQYGRGHLAGSLVLVYCTAWAVLGWRFGQIVLGDSGGFGGVPDEVVPPTHHQPPPPAASAGGGGPGLPPLGGGAYPPIDR